MPFSITEEKWGAFFHYYGHVDLQQALSSMESIWRMPRWGTYHYLISDFRTADLAAVCEEDVLKAVHMDSAARIGVRKFRLAFIVTDAHGRRLLDLFARIATSKGDPVQVFDCVEDARRWAEL